MSLLLDGNESLCPKRPISVNKGCSVALFGDLDTEDGVLDC